MPLTLNIQSAAGFTTPDGGTQTVGPVTVIGTLTPQNMDVTVTSAGITVAVPSGAWVGVEIVPPTTNTFSFTYRTTSGDTGINIPPATPSYQFFDPANLPPNIYLKSGTNMVGQTRLLFF